MCACCVSFLPRNTLIVWCIGFCSHTIHSHVLTNCIQFYSTSSTYECFLYQRLNARKKMVDNIPIEATMMAITTSAELFLVTDGMGVSLGTLPSPEYIITLNK